MYRSAECEGTTQFSWNASLLRPPFDTTALGTTDTQAHQLLIAPSLQGNNLFGVIPSKPYQLLRYVRLTQESDGASANPEWTITLTNTRWSPHHRAAPQQRISENAFAVPPGPPPAAFSRLIALLLHSSDLEFPAEARFYDDIFFLPQGSGILICIFYRQGRRKVMVQLVTPDGQQFLAVFGTPRERSPSSDSSSSSSGRNTPVTTHRRGSGTGTSNLLQSLVWDRAKKQRRYSMPAGKDMTMDEISQMVSNNSTVKDFSTSLEEELLSAPLDSILYYERFH